MVELYTRKEKAMVKNKKEKMIKKTTAIVTFFILGINMLVGCGNGTNEEKTDVSQVESSMMETGTEAEIETDEVESDLAEEEESQTEEVTEETTEAETESQTTSQNSTGNSSTGNNNSNKNNASQNKPSKNNSTQKENENIGLGKESYEYIVGGTSSQNTKEVNLAKGIIKNIIKNGMSDFDKVKAINDYMLKNVSYDMENYKNNTIPAASYTALGALEKKVAVCAGYAKMFRLLATTAGLECTYVTGDTPYGYHAWNQVKVDGKWYNIDVTWNDPDCEKDENGHYYCGCYEYFLLSNEDFEKKHTPMGKVNATGSSRDLEAFKKGCPYDGAVAYCETQEQIDKLVQEMIATNTMSKRILTIGNNQKEMIINALKKNGIYANIKVDTKNAISVYLGSRSTLKKMTIDISFDGASFAEVQKQKITSINDAKKLLEECFKKYVVPAEQYNRDNLTHLYMNGQLANDINFQAELMKWACYEKKMNISFSVYGEQVGNDVYDMRVYYSPKSKEEGASEIITSTKDMEAAIKRMSQYGYKKIYMMINPSDYKLTGESNAARNEFSKKYCKPLNEKYCLESYNRGINVERNTIHMEFIANGHNVEYQHWEISKEATCVSEGLEVKICTICNKPGEQRVIAKNDNHSSYWEQKGDSRTQKCTACSYVGITEVCMGGVWGYFDEAAAKEELEAINRQRAAIRKSETDEWGKVIGIFSPPPLVLSSQLTEYAKERLAVLNANDFEGGVENEYAIRYTPVSNYYKKKYAGFSKGQYHECYDKVGIICFQFDVNGDASRFSKIFVMEFGEVEE